MDIHFIFNWRAGVANVFLGNIQVTDTMNAKHSLSFHDIVFIVRHSFISKDQGQFDSSRWYDSLTAERKWCRMPI